MIHYRYSRLNRLREKNIKVQVGLLAVGCLAVVFLVIKVGVPAIFALSSTLTSLYKSATPGPSDVSLEIPPVPSLTAQYAATSSAFVKLMGQADSELTVVIEKSGDQVESLVTGADGTFEIVAGLTAGSNVFQARTVSAKGKKSEASDLVTVVNITGNPKLEVQSPTDGQTFADEDSIQITGKTDGGNSITVNDRAAIVGADGSFKFFYRLTLGDNRLTIMAADPAGNNTKKDLTVRKN